MAEKANEVGLCRCPVCESTKAHLRVSEKTRLTYVTCNTCNCQVFARSDRSDEALRRRLIAEPAPEPAAAPEPAPLAVTPPAPEKTPQAPKPALAWGVLRGIQR